MLTKQTKLRRELGHSFQLHLLEIRNRRLRPVGDTRMPSGCVIEFKLFLPYRVRTHLLEYCMLLWISKLSCFGLHYYCFLFF